MKIGFTGTREKTTAIQRQKFRQWVIERKPAELHHGGCVGADEVAANVGVCHVRKTICHPPINDALASAYAKGVSDECREPLEYLERNMNIAEECDILLAMPKGPEEKRSGTWFTIRAARSIYKPIVIFFPDGKITEENPQPKRRA